MPRVKKRTFTGSVLEQEVYTVPDNANVKTYRYRPRFANEAQRAQHRNMISRRHHVRLINQNYSPSSYYSTLTFDRENEIHTFDEAFHLRDLYVRRLKRAVPEAKINIYCGRGKSTARIHFHMISDGIPADLIVSKWTYGTVVRVEHLRQHNYYDGIDHGTDYTGLANYLFDHWMPEQGEGKHRWKQTKNVEQPQPEPAQEIKREYSPDHPPRAPKGYELVSCIATPYGYLSFKYVKSPKQDLPHRGKRRNHGAG